MRSIMRLGLLILVSSFAMGQQEGTYAIQKFTKTQTVPASLLPQKQEKTTGICPRLQQKTRKAASSASKTLAEEQSRKISSGQTPPDTTYSRTEERSSSDYASTTEESLRLVWREIHESKPSRTGPLSSNESMAGSFTQQLQLRHRTFLRLSRVVHKSSEVSPQVATFAIAIAIAEGYALKGSIPARCHNPGDLKGEAFPGEVGLCKGGHARFKNDAAGWAALYHQVDKMTGSSTVYTSGMTFRDVARRYAKNYRPWLKIVTRVLDVDDDDSVVAFLTDRDKLRVTYLAEDYDFLRTFTGTPLSLVQSVPLVQTSVY